jgi:imidazolonepropionase-like amidohydrolase
MKVFHADRMIDGSGQGPVENVDIAVENGLIKEIVPGGARDWGENVPVYTNPGKTYMPGFIDVHAHLMFGTPRSYEETIKTDSDELMILRGTKNAYIHLRAGVTTLRECGARNNIGFAIKQGAQAGLFLSPRLLVCGRPLTITGGHFWWCGQEADGVEGVRQGVRQLMKDGADFLKIMGSGGGSLGTDSRRASYTVEELRAAVEEVHQFGKKATIHCISAESTWRAAEAGVDQIEHINFLRLDNTRVFDDKTAEMIAAKGLTISPTIQTGYRQLQKLEQKEKEVGLTDKEAKTLKDARYKTETKIDFTGRFHRLGVPLVMGTDAIREFGDYAIGLELMSRAGLSPMELVISATSGAARALGLEKVGTLKAGMAADMVCLDANPLEDIQAFGQVSAVILNGSLAVDRRFEAQSFTAVAAKNQIVFISE